MAAIGTDIQYAKALLEQGDVVAIPTETVYGLAGNAMNVAAVTRIFDVKNRPQFDPLIVHVPDLGTAENYIQNIPDAARQLADYFWPGPLTLLLEKKDIIPDLVTSGLSTVGIRCPDHPLTRQLLNFHFHWRLLVQIHSGMLVLQHHNMLTNNWATSYSIYWMAVHVA